MEVDFCHRCRGLWLDAGELEALAGTGDSALLRSMRDQPGQPTRPRHLCPRCDRALIEFSLPGTDLRLDRCPRHHGLWFDADELRQVLELLPLDPGLGQTIQSLKDIFGYQQSGDSR